jgi:hypothetical protein
MVTEELKENIKRHYGTSDEDLTDLAVVMDALDDLDKLEEIKSKLETVTLESEQKLKDLDQRWRDRYRERFFDGDVDVNLDDDLDPEDETNKIEDITIDDYVEEMRKEKI